MLFLIDVIKELYIKELQNYKPAPEVTNDK